MRLLLHTMATPDLTPVEALDLAADLGLDGLDLVCQAGYKCALPPEASANDARFLRDEADRRGLVIAAFTPYEKRINSVDQGERTAAISSLCHVVDLADILGATSIRILAGTDVPDSEWSSIAEAMVDVLKRPAAYAAPKKIMLNIENHDGTMADTAVRTREIWRRVNAPNVGVVYDPANLFRDGKEGFPESLEIQCEAIHLVHVKDYKFKAGAKLLATEEGSRRSVPVGDGDIPWTDILQGLANRGYVGDFSFEYEMRWVPDHLPPTRIGVARSRDHLMGILAKISKNQKWMGKEES
jgi:sugar phosphate isomerase/epimerase